MELGSVTLKINNQHTRRIDVSAFRNCPKKVAECADGVVIAPCIGGRAGRGRDGPVRPQ
jgi:hypothetical protein